jgi:hypothetical protein
MGNNQLPSDLSGLIDFILRDHSQYFRLLFESEVGIFQIALLLLAVFLLSGLYGCVMGIPGGWRQGLSSIIKVPMLFVLSLLACVPALFVVTVLIGSKISVLQMMAFMLFSISVSSIVLTGFASIAVFFLITRSGYHFMKVLHVGVFAFSGLWGMAVLWRGFFSTHGASCSGSVIIVVWIAIYAFVGAQMAWILRPFIGEPAFPFELFRRRSSSLNFYSAVALSMSAMSRQSEHKKSDDK